MGGLIVVGVVLGGFTYIRSLGTIGILGAQTMTGTFTLTDTNVELGGGECHGTGGYSDVRDGLGVTIKDQTGKIIGTTGLQTDTVNSRGGVCVFKWTVPNVERVDFYTITVGSRGDLTYSWAEMVGRAWKVDATLGS